MELCLFDRIAFTLFGLDIYWYGLIITSAIILDFILLVIFARKLGFDPDLPYDLVLILLPSAVVVARLFSVLFDADLTIVDYFAFRDGGLSIIGALIGGVLGLSIYCAIKKRNFLAIADILAPLVILGQSIGRWGNFFNKEVYGQLITDETMQWFPYAVQIGDSWYQALFFYEFVANLIGFALLLTLLFVYKKKRGITISAYLIFYGAVRFILEGFRQEKYILKIGNLPISKTFAGVMVVTGIVLLIIILVGKKKIKKANETVRVFNDGKD